MMCVCACVFVDICALFLFVIFSWNAFNKVLNVSKSISNKVFRNNSTFYFRYDGIGECLFCICVGMLQTCLFICCTNLHIANQFWTLLLPMSTVQRKKNMLINSPDSKVAPHNLLCLTVGQLKNVSVDIYVCSCFDGKKHKRFIFHIDCVVCERDALFLFVSHFSCLTSSHTHVYVHF